MNEWINAKGALAEINRQLVHLLERKSELLTIVADEAAANDPQNTASCETAKEGQTPAHAVAPFFPGRDYAKYLESLHSRRDPVTAPRVVYQGEPGAYSEMAAIDFFGKEVRSTGLYQFADTFRALQNGEADYAVLPIENSSTGAIRQVYDLLMQYQYYFIGETTVHVSHNLMALPGTTLDDIDTVYSHEQGLFQCEQFLNAHPDWKRIPQADTAGSAKMVAELADPHKAAICSSRAAEIYGLEILEHGINSNSRNTTRFVVVSPRMELHACRDKICVSLTTTHESGSLHDILSIFAVHGINLVRLESRPIPEHNWEYMFFIEFTGDLMTPETDAVIHELSLTARSLRVLGNFRSNLG